MDKKNEQLAALAQRHPCFAIGGQNRTAIRIHLPLVADCNLRCNYCVRALDPAADRPGVSGAILTPEQAVALVREVCREYDSVQVIGVAGPGEPLLNGQALAAFRLLREEFADKIFCISSNGLLLEENAERLREVKVDTVTVTVNSVRPELSARIYRAVEAAGGVLTGEAAGAYLLQRQQRGVAAAKRQGLTVKINTVLIPTVNDGHIEELAQTVASWGADLINIIPLIPQCRFGDLRPPTCEALRQAREEAGRFLPVFRHCSQCRADAIGVPGVSEYRHDVYETVFCPH